MKNSTARGLIIATSIFSYVTSLLALIAFATDNYLFIFLFQVLINTVNIFQLSLLIKEKNQTQKNIVLLKKPLSFKK